MSCKLNVSGPWCCDSESFVAMLRNLKLGSVPVGSFNFDDWFTAIYLSFYRKVPPDSVTRFRVNVRQNTVPFLGGRVRDSIARYKGASHSGPTVNSALFCIKPH